MKLGFCFSVVNKFDADLLLLLLGILQDLFLDFDEK
jgi:hypothetical protein